MEDRLLEIMLPYNIEFKKLRIDSTNEFRRLCDLEFQRRNRKYRRSLNKFADESFYSIDENGKIIHLRIKNFPASNLDDHLEFFKDLKCLSLVGGKIDYIENICKLRNLELLDLSYNELSFLPNAFYSLINVEHLHLSGNKLNAISDQISNLNKLRTFDISENPNLIELPASLTKLDQLWLDHEKISEIRERKNVAVKNQQYELAADIRDEESKYYSNNGGGIKVGGEYLLFPPTEIFDQGRLAIELYLESIEKSGEAPINEIKIVVIGDGGSGKTSLVKRLSHLDYDPQESQTHGININKYLFNLDKSESVVGHFWDFGGQQIMHATHQFFLSKRAFYIIVIDSRKEGNVEYWLKHVELFGGKSPVIIVINKVDENPGFEINRKFLQEKYKNIVSIHRVSCLKNNGTDGVRNSIISNMHKVELVGTIWPNKWILLKSEIEKKALDFISEKEFSLLASRYKIFDTEKEILLEYLHDLGVVVRFSDFRLRNTAVLNPHWVTEGVYSIINSKLVADSYGVLKLKYLPRILNFKKYPLQSQRYFVDLMKKFLLCYEISDSIVLIPDLFPIEEAAYKIDAELKMLFQFAFLPKSLIAKIIVTFHSEIEDSSYWRTGVLLKSRHFDCKSLIKVDEEEKILHVQVDGYQRRDYYSALRLSILNILDSFDGIIYDERVVLNELDQITVSYSHLIKLESLGVSEYLFEGLEEVLSVQKILGSITKSSEEESFEREVLSLLKSLKEANVGKENALIEANKLLELKPNIAGIGININYIIDRFFN